MSAVSIAGAISTNEEFRKIPTPLRGERQPVVVDLFSGAGGLSLGFAAAGFRVSAAVEIDPIHAATHRLNFPDCIVVQEDIQQVSGNSILREAGLRPGDVDVVVGGPPCQGFSSIGRRRADDPRNRLVFEFARIVHELRPNYFVLENVRGFLFSANRALVDEFVATMESDGYDVVKEIRFLDASDYGVPQQRKRTFILGYRKDVPALSYPDPIHLDTPPTVWDAISDLSILETNSTLFDCDAVRRVGGTSSYVAALEDTFGELAPSGVDHTLWTGCLRTVHTERTIERFSATTPGEREEVSRYQRLERSGISPTLRAGTGSDRGSYMAARPIHPDYPRCITVREAARLHSYPDWFQFHPTRWHGFRQVGNSVPPLLAKTIGGQIRERLELLCP